DVYKRQGQAYVASLVDSLMGMLSYMIGLVITPVLAFYLLNDWYEIKEELLLLLPVRWRHEIILIVKDIDKVLSGVIRGQVTVAIIVGILVSIGLYLLDVKYAVLIGILAGMLDLIPYFGAVIGATPAVTLALLESPYLAVKVALLFFLIHQLEGTVIGPKILGESVGLHPLSVIFFVFVGSELGGLSGMLLGVPAAAVAKVLLRHIVKALV
ncbi:MAG: AI-2E family transporter, partial [Negativicutes bacterium]|nr:AI-2E family transporter [Negativicutes bacterium]